LNNKKDGWRDAVMPPEGGVLVAAFGVRIPQKACWQHPEHPWNGDYLAFSLDHGETWRNVVRITWGFDDALHGDHGDAGGNLVYVSYDLVAWGTQESDG
jgi:hypothetical protein